MFGVEVGLGVYDNVHKGKCYPQVVFNMVAYC